MFRTLLYLLLFYGLTPLNAQTTPQQLSNFNSGPGQQDILTTLYAIGDSLYGNFSRYFGDQNTGLLARIDPETGATTAMLDPDEIPWYGGADQATHPLVVRSGGALFGLQRDGQRGISLYRLDTNRPEPLYTGYRDELTPPVALSDAWYFVGSAGIYRRWAGDVFGNGQPQLWRTDGTAAGTQHVAGLYTQFASNTTLTPGSNKLLIKGEWRTPIALYDPVTDTLQLVSLNGQPLDSLTTPSLELQSEVMYQNGYFYLPSGTPYEEKRFFAIEEATGLVTEIELPVDPRGNVDEASIQFLLGGTIYHHDFAYGTQGDRIHQLNEATLTFEEVPLQAADPFALRNLDANYIVTDSSLLYTSFNDLIEVVPARGLSRKLATVTDWSNRELVMQASPCYIFVGVKGDPHAVYRVNRASGEVLTAPDVTTAVLTQYPDYLTTDYFQLIGDNAYWVDPGSRNRPRVEDRPGGLLRWRAEAEAPEAFGEFRPLTNSFGHSLPYFVGNAYNPTTVLLASGDSVVYYDSSRERVIPIETGASTVRAFYKFPEGPLYGRSVGAFGHRPVRFTDGTFTAIPVTVNGRPAATSYLLWLGNLRRLPDGRPLVRYYRSRGSSAETYAATYTDDTLRLSSFTLPVTELFDEVFLSDFNSDSSYAAYDSTNRLAYVVNFDAPVAVVTADAQGAWTETTDRTTGQANLTYHSRRGEAARIPVGPWTRAWGVSRGRMVNGKLLYLSNSVNAGQELAVADAATETVALLKDINPGAYNSMAEWREVVYVPGGVVFPAASEAAGGELWFTDGTTIGTYRLTDINPGSKSANPHALHRFGDWIYFSANGPVGYEVYRMNVNSLEAELLADIHPGPAGSRPLDFLADDDAFYVLARGGVGEQFEFFRLPLNLVSTNDRATASPATIFPNPVGADWLTIAAPTGERLVLAEVVDQAGRRLRTATFTATELGRLDIRGVPAGAYWVRVIYASGRFSATLVVVE